MADRRADLHAFLGHDISFDPCRYELRNIRDNVELLTPDLLREVLPEAFRQRCYVHYLRNARTRLRACSVRPVAASRSSAGSSTGRALTRRADLAARLAKWQASQPKLSERVEETIEEALSFVLLPRRHHQRMRSTNVLECLNQEIKRRAAAVRIFPDAASCPGLVRALSAEIHETWMEGGRCLDMELLQERRRADTGRLAGGSGPASSAGMRKAWKAWTILPGGLFAASLRRTRISRSDRFAAGATPKWHPGTCGSARRMMSKASEMMTARTAAWRTRMGRRSRSVPTSYTGRRCMQCRGLMNLTFGAESRQIVASSGCKPICLKR